MADEKNERLHRTFVAIDFSDNVIKEVARVQEVLANLKFTGKMTELNNLHLTLKFLGEINEEKLAEASRRLEKIKFEEMELKLGDIGTFDRRGSPRIVWIKVVGKGIFELQRKVDDIFKDLFRQEGRFMGHVTIARVKYVKDKDYFAEYIKGIKLKDIKFKIRKFKLKESELSVMGPVYRDLEVYGL